MAKRWFGLRGFWRDRSGVAAVEFAILALPFFFVIFCLLETSMIFMAEVTMENAVQKVARQVRVGQLDSSSEQAFRAGLCAHVEMLLNCSKLHVDLRSYASFDAVPTFAPLVNGVLNSSDFRFETGSAESIMALRVYYAWPVLTDFLRVVLSNMADNSHLITGHVLFKNEPFQ